MMQELEEFKQVTLSSLPLAFLSHLIPQTLSLPLYLISVYSLKFSLILLEFSPPKTIFRLYFIYFILFIYFFFTRLISFIKLSIILELWLIFTEYYMPKEISSTPYPIRAFKYFSSLLSSSSSDQPFFLTPFYAFYCVIYVGILYWNMIWLYEI